MPGKRMRTIFTSRRATRVKRFERIARGTYSDESDCKPLFKT